MKQRLGEALLRSGAVTEDQLEAALRSQRAGGDRVGSILLRMGAVDEDELGRTLAGLMRARHASPELLSRLERSAPKLLSRKLVRKHRAIPIRQVGRTLHVLVADYRSLTGLSTATGCRIQPWIAPEARVRELLERCFGIRSDLASAPAAGGEPKGAAAPVAIEGDGFEALAERLLGTDDPRSAVRAVLDHASRFMAACVFFRVQDGEARILASHGLGLDSASAARFVVPAWSGTPLELLTVRPRYRGPVPQADPYTAFFRSLGLDVPAEISLLPVSLTERPFGILLGASTPTGKLDCAAEVPVRLAHMLALALTLTLLKDKLRAAAHAAVRH